MRRQGISVAADNDDDLLCKRCLETFASGTAARHCAQQRRTKLINAVVRAQEMGYSHEILQAVSQVYSREDTTKALALGQSDAACVRRIRRREERSTTK
jgi:hypothetical protein